MNERLSLLERGMNALLFSLSSQAMSQPEEDQDLGVAEIMDMARKNEQLKGLREKVKSIQKIDDGVNDIYRLGMGEGVWLLVRANQLDGEITGAEYRNDRGDVLSMPVTEEEYQIIQAMIPGLTYTPPQYPYAESDPDSVKFNEDFE
jgi:hypothetical protein